MSRQLQAVKVFIRPRPTKASDKEIIFKTAGNQVQVREKLDRPSKFYEFDHIFGQRDSPELIYNTTSKSLLEYAKNGKNSTVMAYGCSGTGKSYTMNGNGLEDGIVLRFIKDILLKQKEYRISNVR